MPIRAAFDRSIWLLAGGFALLSLVLLGVLWVADRQVREVGLVTHTLEVESRVTRVMALMTDAETGQRGYLITGKRNYLEPYEKAIVRLGPEIDALATLTADNPRQVASIARLRDLARTRLDLLKRVIERQTGGDMPGVRQLISVGGGKAVMDAIRRETAAMEAEERRLLDIRRQQAQASAWRLKVIVLGGFVVSVMLIGFSVAEAGRRYGLVAAARQAMEQANQRLQSEAANREAAEAQVRQMQKMEAVGQLTGGIAHDFNNMLAVVIGSLDLAKRRIGTDVARAEKGIDHALEGAHRAATLTSRLLAFSRQQPLAPTSLDANRLVSAMSELLRRTLGEQIRLEAVLAGGLWDVKADGPQLESALVNLCVNARDAMPTGGRLTIETSNAYLDDAYAARHGDVTPGQYVMICVSDTGEGMSPEVAQKAFEPFFTTKGAGKGTGLGLSQVFGFVKQSGGHLKIYSEPGQGTAVKIYLPRGDAATASALDDLAASTAVRAGGFEVVLVVEDDADVRLVTVDALRELGYTVLHAGHGPEALQVLSLQPHVDLLFTDIVMPGLSGKALAEEATAARPDLKVLYTTGYTRNAVVHNGVLDAGIAFLQKPFTVEQLAIKVRQVIDGAGSA